MTVDIYDAEAGDIDAIHQVIQATVQDTPKARLFSRLYSLDNLKRTLNSEHRHLIVAIVDDKIVGVCQYGIPIMDDCDCEDLRMIQAIFVHPESDYENIASALVYDVEESINTEAGVQRLSIFIHEQEMTKIKFFASLGFYHDQVEDVDDEWYMEKDL